MKKLILSLIILLAVTGCASTSIADAVVEKNITVTGSEASSLIEDGALLIDVRTKEEYDEKHIDGAINIVPDDIISGGIDYNKDEIIIVYCRSGNRSATAANKLIALGYTNIYDLGSINNW